MVIDENAPGKVSQQGIGDKHDDETSQRHGTKEVEVPLLPDDESPVEEEMDDVDANNSVSSEYPNPSGASSRRDVRQDTQLKEKTPIPDDPGIKTGRGNDKESQLSPGVPASDPESGA
ncbi:hypothetical protein JET68_01680 [Pseudomonas monteilii]|uniref:hypothetical protein n=1 Tax=Pseudomonas TaxID=286 RepID=UPI0018E6CD7F|nr:MULTISPECIES: hypothetical protein [Pseudomonas]MBI6917499.1 hypothetical protein [Pseudomonas monteilii]MCE0936505.1 hypothetical protein [Pseudomonas kurunegalensis]